jgi:hypothetical protein
MEIVMPVSRRPLDILLGDPKGLIIACNMLSSIDDKLVNEDTVRELLDWWFSLYDSPFVSGGTDLERVLDAFDKTIFEKQPIGFRTGEKKPDFILRCGFVSRKPVESEVSNITYMLTFFHYIMHEEDQKKLTGYRVPSYPVDAEDPGIQRVLRQLKSCPKEKRSCRLRSNGTLGRPGRLLWFSDQHPPRSVPYAADVARDQLGLVDYKKGELLVAAMIPSECTAKAEGQRPSFMDAALHTRFRVHADTAKKNHRKTWGHTVDLDKLRRNARNVDGLYERVCRPITTHDVEAINFTYLGQLTNNRGEEKQDDDQAFAQRLLGGVTESAIRARMVKLL